MPPPTIALTASADTFSATNHPATVTLTESHVTSLTTTHNMLISTVADNANNYETVNLTGTLTSTSVTAAINAVSALAVTAEKSGSIEINTTATGPTAKLFVKFQTGTEPNTDGTFTNGSLNLSSTGAATTSAYVVIEDFEINAISSGDKIHVSTEDGTHMNFVTHTFSGALTATAFAAFLNTNLGNNVEATVYGSCVVLTPDTAGTGAGGFITYQRKSWRYCCN